MLSSSRRSPYTRILRRLGLISPEQVDEVEELIDQAADEPGWTTGDLLKKAGLVTDEQLQKVNELRRDEDRTGHRIDCLKVAKQAATESIRSATELQSIAAAIAAKG